MKGDLWRFTAAQGRWRITLLNVMVMPTLLPPATFPAGSAVAGLAVDVVAFAIDQGAVNQGLKVLLVQRGELPHALTWALPGGFVQQDEELAAAALRELRNETSLELSPSVLEQLYTFGGPQRDPRGRVVSVAHLAILRDPQPALPGSAHTLHAEWHSAHHPPPLAFDHADILRLALARLQRRLIYADLALEFLPETFTLPELQLVYEAILDRPLDKRNFRKRILAQGLLLPSGERRSGVGRPAQLYRSKRR